MRTLAKLAVALVLAMTVSACGDFLDINESPNAATSPPANNVFPSAIVGYAQNQASEVGWIHAYHAQSWADFGTFANSARYRIGGFARGNSWSTYYLDGSDLKTVQTVSAENGDVYASAQARLMRQQMFLEATSIYENVPYTQASRVQEFPNPEFDDQETILRGIIANCDTAIVNLKSADGGTPITAGDLIYGGNTDNWIRFANAMKLKVAFMLESGGAGGASDPLETITGSRSVSQEIDNLVALPDAETMRSNAFNANVPYAGDNLTASNPVWQIHARFNNGTVEPGFFDAGTAIVDLMNSKNDPRRKVYFFANDAGNFVGRPPGDFGTVSSDGTSGPSNNVISPDFPVRIFSAAEVLFYEAEALLDSDAAAADAKFEAAVSASIDFFNSYAAGPDQISSTEKQDYLDNLPDLTSTSDPLGAIHEEHYVELFERGTDIWVHQRRTGVPSLGLPQGAAAPGLISRWPYPPEVQVNNPNTPQSPPIQEDMFFQGG